MAQLKTSMMFLEPWPDKIENPFLRSKALDGFEAQNFEYERHEVIVTDARPWKDEFRLDENGFTFVHHPQSATPDILELLQKKDEEGIAKHYYPHVENIIKDATGAAKVCIFDSIVRKRIKELVGKNPDGSEQPAYSVHVDQSPVGAINRVHQFMGDEAPALLKKRCQILNVWRPLRGPVDDWPLGMMDSRTLSAGDCHPTLLWRNGHDFRGSTMFMTHKDEQKWFFLHRQLPEEVTIIKIWDNKSHISAKCCAHCAFEDPRTPPDAPLRESIEARCLVFYDEEI